MKIRNNSVLLTAAFTGLLGGAMAHLSAAPASSSSTPSFSAAGKLSTTLNADADKHACKGKNSCKGQGGCKAGDNGCKAKNSCKGKGGCATDGSKKN